MRNIFLAFTFLFSVTATAADALYLVEPMVCLGTVKQKPSQMHPSYSRIVIKITSLKSMRRDGTLAPGINWQEDYAVPNKNPQIKGDYVGWLMGPLRFTNEGTVYRNNVGGRGYNLLLKIEKSTLTPKGRIDTLVGSYDLVGTVVGNYGYRLVCEAQVVKDTKWVINQTK